MARLVSASLSAAQGTGNLDVGTRRREQWSGYDGQRGEVYGEKIQRVEKSFRFLKIIQPLKSVSLLLSLMVAPIFKMGKKIITVHPKTVAPNASPILLHALSVIQKWSVSLRFGARPLPLASRSCSSSPLPWPRSARAPVYLFLTSLPRHLIGTTGARGGATGVERSRCNGRGEGGAARGGAVEAEDGGVSSMLMPLLAHSRAFLPLHNHPSLSIPTMRPNFSP
jgi:hypothetical protein